MEYSLLRFVHVLGAVLIGGGLIGVWMSDLRARQLRELQGFAEAVRNIAVFYDGIVVPGALLLMASGTWLIVKYHGGWAFLNAPWLAGMAGLFAFEFIEGITRLYFMRLRRLTKSEAARAESVPTFTHFLGSPLVFAVIALGVIQPDTWSMFIYGCAIAVLVAAVLTILIPRLYPWQEKSARTA